ncbi:putative phage tail protein [Sporosarcina koreensis]|uniref:putative phage tail protein n=1 Tax=Sporosarcina koreensis TaxID=334735 RepID=UPI000755C988|nr:putative phage tail protein [Sporosarcina koreensis]
MTLTKRDMLDTLPRYYDDSPEVDAIITTSAEQVDRMRQRARELTDQYYVRTATHGLDDWERVLDLPPRPNSSLEFRRNRILARLNGTAPATVRYLTDVVNAHVADKSARIVEYNGEYRFEAEINVDNVIDTEEIRRDIEEVKPAHLAFGITGVITDAIVMSGHEYTFGVPYPICNVLRTDNARGIADRSSMALVAQDYTVVVPYPICGVFVAGHERSA